VRHFIGSIILDIYSKERGFLLPSFELELFTMARIAAFIPGESPPEVKMAIFLISICTNIKKTLGFFILKVAI
jgi:hypothetical protein